jgi:signal transduction histidine kinase/CheY-like chemotaxis protein
MMDESKEQTAGASPEFTKEMADLRQSVLVSFVFPVLALPVLWLLYVMFRSYAFTYADLAIIQFAPAISIVLRIRERHHNAACWVFLASLALTHGLVVAAHANLLAMAFGVIVVMVADALVGPRGALITATALWLLALGASYVLASVRLPVSHALSLLGLYYLVAGTKWLADRPYSVSVAWALAWWDRASRALAETRERRAELYRVLHALEEATYRIERMNNELIVARDAAEIARENKARFAATVSQEIRGPLNLILGFSRLMVMSPERYETPLPACYRADVDTIYMNSQHLTGLIDDILDLSQIDASRLPLVKEHVDVENEVIQQALATVRPLAEGKGLALTDALLGGLPPILADAMRLRQVMVNLLTNAIRFTERGGIHVRLDKHVDGLMVSVQDTGCGIAAEDVSKLFEEYYRPHASEMSANTGTGLGLAISRHLVELHGGRIWAESTAGQGTTFCFTLPLPDVAGIAGQLSTGQSASRLEPRRVCLALMDDPSLTRLLARHLGGPQLVGLADAEQLVPLIHQLHPRAVLCTHDRQATAREVLAEMPYSVPLISFTLPEKQSAVSQEGAILYLTKPVMSQAVEATMRQFRSEGESTVLVVDDDRDSVRLIEIMLTALPWPYSIVKAYDGAEALSIMCERVPDIVFLDLLMPEISGEQLIATMRGDDRLRHVPIVIVSAQDVPGEERRLGLPITLWAKEPLELSRGIACLEALLKAVSPDYLPAGGTPALPEPTPRA